MSDLTEKEIKIAIINMFIELKENMIKEGKYNSNVTSNREYQ